MKSEFARQINQAKSNVCVCCVVLCFPEYISKKKIRQYMPIFYSNIV